MPLSYTEYSQPRSSLEDRRSSTVRLPSPAQEAGDWRDRSTIPIASEAIDHQSPITHYHSRCRPLPLCPLPAHTRESIPSRGHRWSRIDHRSCDCGTGPRGPGPGAWPRGQAITWSGIDHQSRDCICRLEAADVEPGRGARRLQESPVEDPVLDGIPDGIPAGINNTKTGGLTACIQY